MSDSRRLSCRFNFEVSCRKRFSKFSGLTDLSQFCLFIKCCLLDTFFTLDPALTGRVKNSMRSDRLVVPWHRHRKAMDKALHERRHVAHGSFNSISSNPPRTSMSESLWSIGHTMAGCLCCLLHLATNQIWRERRGQIRKHWTSLNALSTRAYSEGLPWIIVSQLRFPEAKNCDAAAPVCEVLWKPTSSENGCPPFVHKPI